MPPLRTVPAASAAQQPASAALGRACTLAVGFRGAARPGSAARRARVCAVASKRVSAQPQRNRAGRGLSAATLRAVLLAGACACLGRAQDAAPTVVRVSTAEELTTALASTDGKQPAEHIVITEHLDLTAQPPGSSVNQPNQAETMFYITPRTKTIRVRLPSGGTCAARLCQL